MEIVIFLVCSCNFHASVLRQVNRTTNRMSTKASLFFLLRDAFFISYRFSNVSKRVCLHVREGERDDGVCCGVSDEN